MLFSLFPFLSLRFTFNLWRILSDLYWICTHMTIWIAKKIIREHMYAPHKRIVPWVNEQRFQWSKGLNEIKLHKKKEKSVHKRMHNVFIRYTTRFIMCIWQNNNACCTAQPSKLNVTKIGAKMLKEWYGCDNNNNNRNYLQHGKCLMENTRNLKVCRDENWC